MTPQDVNMEHRALEALLVAALRRKPDEVLPSQEQDLVPEDREALARLGSELTARIVSGTSTDGSVEEPPAIESEAEEFLAGAMNRGDADLTEEARKEMERKLHEIDGEDEDDADTPKP